MLQSRLWVHYAPEPAKIVSQHTFHHWNQADRESINAYVTMLCKAAIHCEFWDLDEVHLDRLVCGVRVVKLQWCLLTKLDLTSQQAVDLVQATETAEQSTLEILKPSKPLLPRQPIAIHKNDCSNSKQWWCVSFKISMWQTVGLKKRPIYLHWMQGQPLTFQMQI